MSDKPVKVRFRTQRTSSGSLVSMCDAWYWTRSGGYQWFGTRSASQANGLMGMAYREYLRHQGMTYQEYLCRQGVTVLRPL